MAFSLPGLRLLKIQLYLPVQSGSCHHMVLLPTLVFELAGPGLNGGSMVKIEWQTFWGKILFAEVCGNNSSGKIFVAKNSSG